MPITLLDLALLIVMLVSALLAMIRGFMREILSIAAWAAAALATLYLFNKLTPLAQQYFNNDIVAKAVVVGGVFLGTLLIVSVLTGIPVRRDVAMTGEVTLRGNVLPIGGLKEKLLAALRGGITTVMIPQDNVKDLREIPDNVKNGLELIPVSSVMDVLRTALTRMPEPIEWDEAAEAAKAAAVPPAAGEGQSAPAH